MSKINAVRFINLNYNNNAIKISDETFHLNGESTLISLRNGGGKSVLVQMMTAPFVHKRYRDAKDRPFASYFTTAKPTFILVEWALDQGAGYVTTGLMVRRSQEVPGEEREQREELDVVAIVSEYRERCIQDIHHLPVVEKTKREVTLKNFGACRQLFETYKKDKSMKFFYYDLNQPSQSRQYFEKLKEYQIDYKEWETIIKKVNLKESGLSDLFSDCRDEKGLVEKWFLEAVESKLNKNSNRIHMFQSNMEKYVGQYRENQSKFQRRDIIRAFRAESAAIQDSARCLKEESERVGTWENRIAAFLAKLEQLKAEREEEQTKLWEQIQSIRERIAFLAYERISGQIHALEEQERFHSSNRDMIDMEREAVDQQCIAVQRQLNRLACARQKQRTQEDEMELRQAREALAVSRKRQEDLEPERKQLGYTLRRRHEEAALGWEREMSGLKKETEDCRRERTSCRQKGEQIQEQLVSQAEKAGRIQTKVRSFDVIEERFNRQYGENLARNLLGEYEAGSMSERMDTYERQLEETRRGRMSARRELEELVQEKKSLTRAVEETRQQLVQSRAAEARLLQTRDIFQRELEQRRTILRYLELSESQLFDREQILSQADKKLKEIDLSRRELERQTDELRRECDRLTQGKVLELPAEFEELLDRLGVSYIYGMEWLKKNGRTVQENQTHVKACPFLPYALIMTSREFQKLDAYLSGGMEDPVYTAAPIPILLREELDQGKTDAGGAIVLEQKTRFYVYFNDNLLDEETLKKTAQALLERIKKADTAAARRREEYGEYVKRRETVRTQAVTKEAYEENVQALEQLRRQVTALTEDISRKNARLEEMERQADALRLQIPRFDQEVKRLEEKIGDFRELLRAYEAYLEDRRQLEICLEEQERLKAAGKRNSEAAEQLENRLLTLENRARSVERLLHDAQERAAVYARYQETQLAEGETEELEARYEAVTSQFSAEQRELERREDTCRKRYERSLEELSYMEKKYSLKREEWQDLLYDRKEEEHQESLLEDWKRKKQKKDAQWNEEDKRTALLSQQIRAAKKKMKEECGQEAPLPKSEIVTEDFEEAIHRFTREEQEQQKEIDRIGVLVQTYDAHLAALAEYRELPLREEVIWEESIESMDRERLTRFRGEMVRDYRLSLTRKQEDRNRLEQVIHQVLRMESFQEDFYRKPLEQLLPLTGNADQVLSQLSTTLQSYDALMEKLEVDLSVVEKEKERILELFEEYVQDVHGSLGKIDQNSTITIRQKPVKMLKIQLPDWEENRELYQMRLSDFMDHITRKGMEIFEKNENTQEFFGTQITTRNLYDTVVGIGNVQIRLFKIEEQREYPITWTDVAKNSGGEGFLSAFVILSSLLYYMRKDDTDLFADKNEGKVLLMDNPFAQTNASHLLKPLMDMADKTNTQLIALSGLGGESIYSRFDNIYVLNLVAARLRSGTQYVRTDHVKGSDADTVMASRVQVAEQMELLF